MLKLPSQKYLKSILDYNPDTGIFVWKWRNDMPLNWNARFYNKIAGENTVWGYRAITINYETYMAHNLLWLYMTGEWPSVRIDHKDLNGKNNEWKNIRLATRSQNQCNRRKQSNNTSGYKGVSFDLSRNKWKAQIQVGGKNYFLGRYDAKEIAYEVYIKALKEKHGEFARAA